MVMCSLDQIILLLLDMMVVGIRLGKTNTEKLGILEDPQWVSHVIWVPKI